MSDTAVNPETFASGRYSKRKRTQIKYSLSELDVSDSESDLEPPQTKKPKAQIKNTSRSLPKRKIFPFMQLPGEIRNAIYTYALTDPSGINLIAMFKHKRRTVERVSSDTQAKLALYSRRNANKRFRADGEDPTPLVPSLLAVSKQVHFEARAILYDNEFIFGDTCALYNFLINFGSSGAKDLKKLRLLRWSDGPKLSTYNHTCFSVLVWAENLTAVHIENNGRSLSADRLYRDAFPWLEAVARQKGKANAALDVLSFNVDDFAGWRFVSGMRVTVPGSERLNEFKVALSKLLVDQQQRLMGEPSKRRKASKDV